MNNNYYRSFTHTYEELTYDKLNEILRGVPLVRCVDFKDISLFNHELIGYKLYENKQFFMNEDTQKFPIESYHKADFKRGGHGLGIVGFWKGKLENFYTSTRVGNASTSLTLLSPDYSYCEKHYGYNKTNKTKTNFMTRNNLNKLYSKRIHIVPHIPFSGFKFNVTTKYFENTKKIETMHTNNRSKEYQPRIRLLTLSGDTRGKPEFIFNDDQSRNGNNFDLQLIICKNLNQYLGSKGNNNIYNTSPIADKEVMLVSNTNMKLLCSFLYPSQQEKVLDYFSKRKQFNNNQNTKRRRRAENIQQLNNRRAENTRRTKRRRNSNNRNNKNNNKSNIKRTRKNNSNK